MAVHERRCVVCEVPYRGWLVTCNRCRDWFARFYKEHGRPPRQDELPDFMALRSQKRADGEDSRHDVRG